MSTIRRTIPQSTPTRYRALRMAKQKNDSAGGATVLTAVTAGRLKVIFPAVQNAITEIDQKQALGSQATADKNNAIAACSLYTRHFLLTVIMAVEREEVPKSILPLYGLTIEKPVLPDMVGDEAVIIAAEKTVSGETARVAAGGPPLPMPTGVQVKARLDAAQEALNNRSNAADNLDLAQEAMNALITEADGVIKKIWDEAETFHNEESAESRRANCRQWGVVYVSDTRIAILLQALQVTEGKAVPVTNATLVLTELDGDAVMAGPDGVAKLKTGYTGEATLVLSAPGFATQTFTKTVDGSTDIDLGEVTMVKG